MQHRGIEAPWEAINTVSDQQHTSYSGSCGTFGNVNKEIFKQESAKKPEKLDSEYLTS